MKTYAFSPKNRRARVLIIYSAAGLLAAHPSLDINYKSRRDPKSNASVEKAVSSHAAQQFVNMMADNFFSSLDMKENVDFLITPALLVQDALAQNATPTYPAE